MSYPWSYRTVIHRSRAILSIFATITASNVPCPAACNISCRPGLSRVLILLSYYYNTLMVFILLLIFRLLKYRKVEEGYGIMIRIKLSEVMGRLRIKQSELIRRTGIRPGTINNLYHDRTKRIEVEQLNRICEVLNCQPGDIFEYVPDESV